MEEGGMTITYRNTSDASTVYRERSAIEVARTDSSAEVGNLAAVTKNSTFQYGPATVYPVVELPRSQATAIPQR
jgi:hypothetical protein